MKIRLIFILPLLLFTFISTAFATEQITIGVKGMTCSFCSRGVKRRLEKLPGVESARPDVDMNRIYVVLKDGTSISDEDIKSAVETGAYEVTSINREEAQKDK